MSAIGADPRVHGIAEEFVDELLITLSPPFAIFGRPGRRDTPERDALVRRAAAAMQQAIEDELEAIRRDVAAVKANARPIASCGFCIGVDLGTGASWTAYSCTEPECGYESTNLAEALEHARSHGWRSLAIGSPSRK